MFCVGVPVSFLPLHNLSLYNYDVRISDKLILSFIVNFLFKPGAPSETNETDEENVKVSSSLNLLNKCNLLTDV